MLSHLTIAKQCSEMKEEWTLLQLLSLTLPNNKILDWSKLKAFADDKMNLNKKSTCFGKAFRKAFGKGRKHGRKRRKCWLPAFSPFPTMFSKGFSFSVVKSQDCMGKG